MTLHDRSRVTNWLMDDLGWSTFWVFDDGFESGTTQLWSSATP